MLPGVFQLKKPDGNTKEGYEQTVQLLKEWEAGIEVYRQHYIQKGATGEGLQRLLDPMECFRDDLVGQLKSSKYKPTPP